MINVLLALPSLLWQWLPPMGTEILDACPDSKGQRVALVRRLHWPDGAEAESDTAEATVKKLEARAKLEPRFQDPEVVLLKASGENAFVDWGWDPDFSPDGQRLSYSHQAKPATGLRILAATLEGNWLEEWSNGSHRVLCRPDSGFLASPRYSSDGRQLLYQIRKAVNGAWPGTVGAGIYNFGAGAARTLFKPAKQLGLDVLLEPGWIGNEVLAIRAIPLRAGTFLSDSYQWDLLALSPAGAKLRQSLGKGDYMRGPSLESRMQHPRVSTQGHMLILKDNQGRELWRRTLPGEPAGLRWSANHRYLSVICTHMRRMDFERDELLVFSF